jgi:hypothetical protein
VKTRLQAKRICFWFLPFSFLLLVPFFTVKASAEGYGGYEPVPGLIDLRTTYSDGAHSIEEIVKMARSRGFRVLSINDHDRIALSYGVPPFRNILRYKKEFPSIMTHGPDRYLEELSRVSAMYPDMVIIPGCITSPFYYWTGSWFRGDLTVHQYDRRILILNFDNPEDYSLIPNIGNRLSFHYTRRWIPGLFLFLIPIAVGLLLLFRRGRLRIAGILLIALSCLAVVDFNPLRSSPFSPYAGDEGIAPYQEVINFVNQRGGLAFWDYPEQRSGVRKYGPIFADTPPYPEVLYQSSGYTGFAAIYGDNIRATDPGREWDRVLNEYCQGRRRKPVWGISAADFHEDGRLGLKLGSFPTTFLVRTFSKAGVLDAIRKGRLYCSRGDGETWPKLDDFQVIGSAGRKAIMGETMTTNRPPVIQFKVSFQGEKVRPMKILLIRGGTLLRTFEGDTPLEARLTDEELSPGELSYYRLMDSRKHLTSNPIFVRYQP